MLYVHILEIRCLWTIFSFTYSPASTWLPDGAHLFVVPKVCGLNLLCVLQRQILREVDVQQTFLGGHLLANTSDLPVLVANAEDVRGINTEWGVKKKDARNCKCIYKWCNILNAFTYVRTRMSVINQLWSENVVGLTSERTVEANLSSFFVSTACSVHRTPTDAASRV